MSRVVICRAIRTNSSHVGRRCSAAWADTRRKACANGQNLVDHKGRAPIAVPPLTVTTHPEFQKLVAVHVEERLFPVDVWRFEGEVFRPLSQNSFPFL